MNDGPNRAIYGDISRQVPIHIGGRTFQVPDGILLIRALQYIEFELGQMSSDWSRFCFNDTIGCCHCERRLPGEESPSWARACCQRVSADLEVVTLPIGTRLLEAP